MNYSDPTDLRGHEREAERDEALGREKRRKELEDLKWIMAHAQGRRVVWRLLERAGLYRSSFNHSGSLMSFNEGRRDMGLFVLAEISEAAPEGYLKLLRENQGKHE